MNTWAAISVLITCLIAAIAFLTAQNYGYIKASFNSTELECEDCPELSDCVTGGCDYLDLLNPCNITLVKNTICESCPNCSVSGCTLAAHQSLCDVDAVKNTICPNCKGILTKDLDIYLQVIENGTQVVNTNMTFVGSGIYQWTVMPENRTIRVLINATGSACK